MRACRGDFSGQSAGPIPSFMNTRLLASFILASLTLSLFAFAQDKAPAATTSPANGYQVMLDLKINAIGTVDDATVFSSDDKSVDHTLERIAMEMVRPAKFQPKLKDGKPVAYTARAPFNFEVENDEGLSAANIPEPHIRNAVRPVYPADLGEKGEVGGVIFNMTFAADGSVTSIKPLWKRSSSGLSVPPRKVMQQWRPAAIWPSVLKPTCTGPIGNGSIPRVLPWATMPSFTARCPISQRWELWRRPQIFQQLPLRQKKLWSNKSPGFGARSSRCTVSNGLN
jgi:TonB family protein